MNKVCSPVVEAIGAPVSAGVTWGHFKQAVERLGVTDGQPLASIEFGVAQLGSGRIVAEVARDGVEIREL